MVNERMNSNQPLKEIGSTKILIINTRSEHNPKAKIYCTMIMTKGLRFSKSLCVFNTATIIRQKQKSLCLKNKYTK